MHFDWNDSPLSIEAAQARGARDAEHRQRISRAAQQREMVAAQAKHEGRQAPYHEGAYQDVNVACTAFLRSRNMIGEFFSSSNQVSQRTRRIVGILFRAKEQPTSAQVCELLGGTVTLREVHCTISYLKTAGHIVASGTLPNRTYALTPQGIAKFLPASRNTEHEHLSRTD